MLKIYRVAIAVVLLAPVMPAALAQNAECRDAQFGEAVLERFPRIREACLDIVTHQGQEYAVFKADLVRTTRNSVRVRFKKPDGTSAESQTINVKPDFRVLIEGKPTRVDNLAVGQELTAYVKVREPMVALAPAEDSQALEPTPWQDENAMMADTGPALPATAGFLPAFGLGGLAMLLLGGVLRLLRRSPALRT
jgi:hypothetical protein